MRPAAGASTPQPSESEAGLHDGPRRPIKIAVPFPPLPVGACVFIGTSKFGWLNKLNNSARNCNLASSLRLILFVREKSKFLSGGPHMIFRPAFPNSPGAGRVKIVGSNQ